MFGLLINCDLHLHVIQTLFLSNSVAWVAIKPMCSAIRTRVSGDKDCCTLSELTEARGREIREFLIPHPLIMNMWQICGIPRWAQQKVVSDSLNIIVKKACKDVIDPVIRQKADGETSTFSCHNLLVWKICSWDVGFARRSSIHEPEG